MLTIGFIGAGTVGTALAVRLSSKGYPVVAVSSLNKISATNLAHLIRGCRAFDNTQAVADLAELVFITTQDSAIASVASETSWCSEQSVVHCSGAYTAELLESAKNMGARVGVMHPLQTFAGVRQAIENMPESTFTIEAEETLLTILKDIVNALGGRWIELKACSRVAYHAAAVIASNYLVTLLKLATDLWQTFGIPQQQATQALLPLIRGTVNNIDTIGIPQCLTGPIARGDNETVIKHLQAFEKVAPSLLSTYKELGLQTIPIALAKGRISPRQADELRALLK